MMRRPKLMRRGALVTLLGLSSLLASGQAYFNTQHPLEPLGYVGAMAVMPTDSGYVTVGFGTPGPPYDVQMLTAFFDTQGQVRRHRLFGHTAGPNITPCQSGPLTALPDGGFVSAGAVTPAGQAPLGQLWRFTAAGDTLWTRTYRPTGLGLQVIMQQQCYVPSDSGFALIGNEKPTLPQTDLLLLRTDKTGRERWRHTYRQAGQGYHVGWRVLVTPDDGFLLVAYSALNSGGSTPFNGDWLVIKTDSLGQEQWRYTLATPYHDAAGAAVCLPDGGYLVAGSYGERFIAFGGTEARAALVRLDAQGQELWRRFYGPARYSTVVYNMHLLADGSAVLAGQTAAPPQQLGYVEELGFAAKVCAATGDSIWYRTYRYLYGPNSRNYLRDFTPTPDGGFVGTGFLHPLAPDTGPQPIWLFKTDQDGYVEAGGVPPTTVVCPPLGVGEEAIGQALEIYPNPTLPDGRFTLEAPAGATLILTDALGRVVWRRTHLGSRSSDLALPHAGLYLLRLTWPDGRSVTRKLVRE